MQGLHDLLPPPTNFSAMARKSHSNPLQNLFQNGFMTQNYYPNESSSPEPGVYFSQLNTCAPLIVIYTLSMLEIPVTVTASVFVISVSDSTVTGTFTVTFVFPSYTVRLMAVTSVNAEPVICIASAAMVPAAVS